MFELLLAGTVPIGLVALAAPGGEARSEDAIVRFSAEGVELETAAVVHRFDISGQSLRRTAWINRKSGIDLLDGQAVEDFALIINGERLSSATPGWQVAEPVCEQQEHGEIRVSLRLERDGLKVTRFYVVHPGLSLIRGWLEIENAGQADVALAEPPICSFVYRATPLTLMWMSGAEYFGDSWRLRAETLATEARVFDSYDAPPGARNAPLPGDGVDVRILLNGALVWPETGWAHSAHAGDVQDHAVTTDLNAGDQLMFVLSRSGNMGWDTTEWDPVISYEDGESFRASEGFSTEQGKGGWSYKYLTDGGQYEDLIYDGTPGPYGERWRLKLGVIEPFISATEMHPDPGGHAVRVFTAPRPGRVSLTRTFRNTGNAPPAGSGFRLGSMAYAPWFCLRNPNTGEAAYVGFDCMAHWRAEIAWAIKDQPQSGTSLDIGVAGFHKSLQPGQTVRTPYAFTGVFADDLDNMGEETLEWQYRYLWDYTREPWFPAVRMLGYWMKGTSWGAHGWVGGGPDMESTFRKVFRIADFMRYVGGDTYHRDWGWWDRAGDWNGPDFRASGEYLRRYGMGQLIYAFIYTVDSESSVARTHPEWLANPNTLDQSMPEVVDYEAKLLHEFYERWNPYQWRNDSFPLAPRNGDDTVLLGQQQGFMEVLKRFLDDHPDCAFQGVNGGGMGINWEYLKFASGFQYTDGQSQMLANYHISYLFPPDKINNMPDIWDPDKYDPATWRGLLCGNIDMTGDTFDPQKLEGLRDLLDVYHYLQSRGVVGRWVRIYHPVISGDDETMYLERLSWDRQRGIIITKHKIEGTVTIRPKGLVKEGAYEVGFHESADTFARTGAELMAEGITLTDPAPGELIYLNLPDHPGNKIDLIPPSPPRNVVSSSARYMGVPGVELRWEAAEDDHWLSHYTLWRNGKLIDKVAKGCFYFDHSAGADPAARYEVRAVDGSGNESAPGATPPLYLARRLVFDDADEGIEFSGDWTLKTGFWPAYEGTLSNSDHAGASLILRFTGRSVTWHSRLGAEGGLARVFVDDEEPVTVSCYAADEIPGWPLFEREFNDASEHTLRIEVAGKPDPRSSGARVWIDGISVCS